MPGFIHAADSARSVVRADVKTGRLVRSVVVPALPKPAPAEVAKLVEDIASQQGVEAPLVESVIRAESNYNPAAVSPKGAQGMMQLIPSTAQRFGVGNTFDPTENITGGVRYLRFLLDYYHGDYTRTIAAYNAGEAAVDKYQGVPPYAETQNYVKTVAKNLTEARQKRQSAAPKPAVTSDGYPQIRAEIGADGLTYYRTP